MDYESRLQISYYETVAPINEEHNIFLVRHKESQHFYVKKILSVYNIDIYKKLMDNPIPGIPKIYAMHEEDGKLTVIEEYISGISMQELITTQNLNDDKIIHYISELCKRVEALHSFNPPIIHRDIKPSNIIITPLDDLFLVDLNAARPDVQKEEDTTLLGTKGYAAPEQYGFGSSDPRTDIYAIGMLINTLLWGEYNHEIHKNKKFKKIIKKCTMLNPDDRYKKVSSILRDLPSYPKREPNIKYRFLPPGFRTLNPQNIIISCFVYFVISVLSFSLTSKDSSITTIYMERIACFSIFLSSIAIVTDYLNIQRLVPLCRSRNIWFRIFGIIIMLIVNVFTHLIILFILENIFS